MKFPFSSRPIGQTNTCGDSVRRQPLQRGSLYRTLRVCMTLSLCCVPLYSRGAEPVSIAAHSSLQSTLTVFLWDENGDPLPAPDAYIQEGGIFAHTVFLGTIDPSNNIIDSSGRNIGFVGLGQVLDGP